MTRIKKLSVEKALEKIRGSHPPESRKALPDDRDAALEEEIARMKAQRLRLERHQRKRD